MNLIRIGNYSTKKIILLVFFAFFAIGAILGSILPPGNVQIKLEPLDNEIEKVVEKKQTLPEAKTLQNNYHIFQSFNNCGPAALSMALSYYGINKSQEELGRELRPFQVVGGDNDDKSVTLPELSKRAKELGLTPYFRPSGNIDLLKYFIANDVPVITKTWLKPNEDIGHFRVVKGYDDNRGILVQDDSLQGKSLEYSYSEFNEIWSKFNFEFLVLATPEKQALIEKGLGELLDEKRSWEIARSNASKILSSQPNDIYARFNLSVALYNLRDYRNSTLEYEKVEQQLPFRTLWYQSEPIRAYFELGNYERVFEISNRIINTGNRAYSELYILRGRIYQNQGFNDLANAEFQKAYFYNQNLEEARNYAL